MKEQKERENRMKTLKVSAQSSVKAVAGAIAHTVEEEKKTEITAIGAGAVNQMIKAVATARGYLAARGIDIVCIPMFGTTMIGEAERKIIKVLVVKTEEEEWKTLK